MSAAILPFSRPDTVSLKAAIEERRKQIAAIEADHSRLADEVRALIAKRKPDDVANEQAEMVADTVAYDLMSLFDEQIGELEAEIDSLDSRLMAITMQDMDDPIDLRPLLADTRGNFHRPGPFDAA